MTIFYKTTLSECETYEEFKENISKYCHFVAGCKMEGFYDVEQYPKTFKGFDIKHTYFNLAENHCYFLRNVCLYNLIAFTSPEFNTKTKTVTFFESTEKREKGVRSNPTKMGKFFRKIAPYFNDKQIEFLVNYTVDYFTDSVYEHNVAKGNEITEIYISKTESGRNTGDYNCINASCMRHDDWQIHPTKVYATESWELHYLTNEEGDIGARALVCKEDNAYNYIYASCEHAGKTLEHKLKDLGFVDCEEVPYAFKGAKLLKIESNGGIVAPYIDYHCDVKDCGDRLEITYGCADYSFNGTSGYIQTTYSCEECGCNYYEEDMISIDGYLYCPDCVFFCDHFDEYAVGESFRVFYSNYGSYNVCKDALEDMGAVYNEEENEWQTEEWFAECTKEDEKETEDENEPKKEIAPGVECVVVSGYENTHYFPIGTVVKVVSKFGENMWDCRSNDFLFSQNVEAKDLVVVE